MLLGTDPVQMDAYGCQLMGLRMEAVPYIRLAEQWGAGTAQVDEVIRLNEPKDAAVYPAASGLIRKLTANVKADSACSACYAALVRALYIAQEERISVRESISIGQSFRGKTIRGIGIGNCCLGADVCVKGCPQTSADVVATFKMTHNITEAGECIDNPLFQRKNSTNQE